MTIEPTKNGPLSLVETSADSVKLRLPEISKHAFWVLSINEIMVRSENTLPAKQGIFDFTRTHASGWTITGNYAIDWFEWAEDFSATHPVLGFVRISDDNFHEAFIIASSIAAWNSFVKAHPVFTIDFDNSPIQN